MGRFGLGPASGSNMRVSISGPVSSFYFKSNCVSGFGLFLVVFLVFPGRYFLQSEAGERQSSGLVSGSTVMRPNLGSASGSSCTTSGSNSGSVSDWFWCFHASWWRRGSGAGPTLDSTLGGNFWFDFGFGFVFDFRVGCAIWNPLAPLAQILSTFDPKKRRRLNK